MNSALDSALKVARLVLTLVATMLCLVLIGIGVETIELIRDSQRLVEQTERRVVDTSQNTNALLIQAGLAADNIRRSSEQWEAASREQRVYWQKTSVRMETALAELELTISDVRTKTLPALNSSIAANDERAQAVLEKTAEAMTNLSRAADNAAAVAGDPNIAASIENVRATTENLEATSAHVEVTAENVKKTSAHIEKKVEQMTRPASLTKTIFITLLQVGGAVGSIFAGLVK